MFVLFFPLAFALSLSLSFFLVNASRLFHFQHENRSHTTNRIYKTVMLNFHSTMNEKNNFMVNLVFELSVSFVSLSVHIITISICLCHFV